MEPKEVACLDVNWNQETEHRVQWLAIVNTVIDFRVL
jgi:hypothetical protein